MKTHISMVFTVEEVCLVEGTDQEPCAFNEVYVKWMQGTRVNLECLTLNPKNSTHPAEIRNGFISPGQLH
jgi:hypothetical protein